MSRWDHKVVAITGGSAGLGLSIARAFAECGAQVVLLARNSDRLKQAAASLSEFTVSTVTADVTDEKQVSGAIGQILSQFGRLDALVNNVGQSVRVPLCETTPDQYRKFMEINFISAVNCTLAAIDAIAKTSGHIVNIGSLSCKTAWPYLAPYSTSKFALAAFTHHLRLEGPEQIHYLLVCPGPIRRPDEGIRYDEQAKALPDTARKPGAGVNARGTDPLKLSRKIVRACEKNKRELVPLRARLIFVAAAISPRLGDWLLKRMMKD